MLPFPVLTHFFVTTQSAQTFESDVHRKTTGWLLLDTLLLNNPAQDDYKAVAEERYIRPLEAHPHFWHRKNECVDRNSASDLTSGHDVKLPQNGRFGYQVWRVWVRRQHFDEWQPIFIHFPTWMMASIWLFVVESLDGRHLSWLHEDQVINSGVPVSCVLQYQMWYCRWGICLFV